MPKKDYSRSQIELIVQHLSSRRSGLVAQLDGYNCLSREQREQALRGQINYTKNVIGWITGEIGRLEQMYAGVRSETAPKTAKSSANVNRRRANCSDAGN